MKKLISLILLVLLILFSSNAIAIPTFGTLMPKGGEYQGGARADFIFERDVKDYDAAETTAYYYKMSYGFADWFCFDGLIGMGNVLTEYKDEKELRYPYNFSGGYGWRAKLYKNEMHGIDWVFGFQHVSTHPSKQWLLERRHEIIWDDWQLSTLMSKQIWNFTPYCGMKWSFVYLISKLDGDRHRRISNSPPIGLVVGTDLRVNNYIYLNVESRFFDETGLNAGFTIRY